MPLVLFAESEAEKILAKMTLDQKIGQLFMVPACPLGGEKHKKELLDVIKKYHVGSVIVKASDSFSQVQFINELQEFSPIALLVAADAEWGLGMRVTDAISYPRNLTLGAIQNEELLYHLGKEIGKECKITGVHINLAPVVDVNCNPMNPIIHMRSFGEDPKSVARKATLLMQGMQEMGILACAKHFPGHGDTAIDSHLDLPLIDHPFNRLEEVELYPFREIISAGISCLMSAHLRVPSLEEEPLPSTLSYATMEKLAREKLGFNGLIISDALNMKALTNVYSAAEIALLAHKAGNDILLYGDHIAPNVEKILLDDVPKAFAALKHAYEKGELDEKQLSKRVLSILQYKEKIGLLSKKPFTSLEQIALLHSEAAIKLKEQLYSEAITVVANDHLLPLSPLTKERIGLLEIGGKGSFRESFFSYKTANDLLLHMHPTHEEIVKAFDFFAGFPKVVVAVHDLQPRGDKYGLSEAILSLLHRLQESKAGLILVLFGTPYALKYFDAKTIVVAYEDDADAEKGALEVLFGKKTPAGKLPVTASEKFPTGTGISWK